MLITIGTRETVVTKTSIGRCSSSHPIYLQTRIGRLVEIL